mgnify:CR=1 FL=1
MDLKRELGFLDVFSVSTGAMISSGLFVLPGLLYAETGGATFLVYLVALICLIPALLSKAELVTAMPRAGGTYFFIDRSLGPGFGMVGGTAAWASLAFKSAFALLGMGAFLKLLISGTVPVWEIKLAAAGLCLAFMAINMLGVKLAGRLQIGLVAVLICVLLAYGIGAMPAVEWQNFRPMLPRGWSRFLPAIAMVFVCFGGVTKAATLGEEVRDPRRDLVRGLFASAAVVGFLYVLTVFVTVGVLPGDRLANNLTPLSLAGEAAWGRWGMIILSAAALCAFMTTANAGILAASRTVMAMARGDQVPEVLGRVNKRTGTPLWAVGFTAIFMLVVILALDLKVFVKAASAMKIMLFMFEMFSVVLMREARLPSYRPLWRSPFYPWTQVVGLVCYAFLLIELGSGPILLAAVIIGGAMLWHVFSGVQSLRESALKRIAQRVASADFPEHDLEAELSKITRERDQIQMDRFDQIIQECPVLQIEEEISREDLFEMAAEELSSRLKLTAEEILDLLKEREEVSSTVIRPGFALPHSISEEVDSFQILLARCRAGVHFEDTEKPVHAVFIMLGPKEERNFYLRALMAVAEVAQNVDFDEEWMKAGSKEALRELVLRAKRRRDD